MRTLPCLPTLLTAMLVLCVSACEDSVPACGGDEGQGACGDGDAPGDGDGDAPGDGDGDAPGDGDGDSEVNPDPILCGGAYEDPCAADKFCKFDSTCGTAANCVTRPTTCDGDYLPVCGCDGQTYSNECEANTLGVAVQAEGECPSALVSCGSYSCGPGNYCIDKGESALGQRYVCLTIPDACELGTVCNCLKDPAPCINGASCTETNGVVSQICEPQ